MVVHAAAEVRERPARRDEPRVLPREEQLGQRHHRHRDLQRHAGQSASSAPSSEQTAAADAHWVQIAPYFSKVECFCFEEQKLLAGEEIDMPLLFFIDRDVLDDPTCRNLDDIVLSYTFFR